MESARSRGGGRKCALPLRGNVCVVALGLRTASANARVKLFGNRMRAHWFNSRARLLCRQRKTWICHFSALRDPNADD